MGNPNVGKSVIFGYLTGSYATVSNYPGTTVELSRGKTMLQGNSCEVIDTPGVNSLIPMSEDEAVTRNILLEQKGIVIQVADAKNLARALPLTFQIMELKIPFVFVINMCDEAARSGIKINAKKLESLLGVPVLTTVATRGVGLAQLKEKISDAKLGQDTMRYSKTFGEAIAEIETELPKEMHGKRAVATMLLSQDRTVSDIIGKQLSKESREKIENVCRRIASSFAEPINFLMGRERSSQAQNFLNKVVTHQKPPRRLWGWLNSWTMHPLLGLVVLAAVLEAVYLFVGKFGAGTAVDFIETDIFGKYISPSAIWLVDKIFSIPHHHIVEEGMVAGDYVLQGQANVVVKFFHDAFVGPYGLVTMGLSYGLAIVLPIVTTFFIAFSLMEDSGYLPRLAVMVNRCFKWMGLNGKAVLPMVLGLGCDTMATLTTRILETKKQRVIVTLLLALAVPCSAQLGVLLGMFGRMPVWTFWVWFSVMMGVMFFVGFASNKILAGEPNAFVMEIPPLRMPQIGNVAKKTLSRLEWYVKEAIPLFLLGTFILFLLDAFHFLGAIQNAVSPIVVTVLGLPKEAANAFLIGFLRRDYGATGFFDMFTRGQLSVIQALVALVVITLFVPCVANIFMMVKEHGGRVALKMVC
ncbi:MAG: ferrous iron transport protein B, partial [bacterium]|nr:ferrous iron transport protein B [bacterium]